MSQSLLPSVTKLTVISEENVRRFEVAVYDSSTVNVLQAIEQLPRNAFHLD